MEAKKEKIVLFIVLLALGLFSLIAQVILIRELILSFYGNELWLGLTLAFWLVSTGIGSFWLSKIFKSKKAIKLSFNFSLIFAPIFFAQAIILSRLAKVILTNFGELPDLIISSIYSFIVILPLGLALGLQFVLLAKMYGLTRNDKGARTISLAYILESIGFLIGAIIFSFYLVSVTSLAAIIFTCCIFYWVILLIFNLIYKAKVWSLILLCLIILISFLFLNFDHFFNYRTSSWRFRGEDLLAEKHSRLGTIALTQIGEQYNVYYNGSLITTSQNKYESELKVDLPILVGETPTKVLILGNGFSGAVQEVLKYPIESVTYVEADKELYANSIKYFPDKELLDEPRVNLVFQDSRYFLANNKEKFDLIIIGQTNPNTLADNRNFTQEFFSLIKNRLSENGILELIINTTPNYTFGAQDKLLTILYQTLKNVYQYVHALPENEVVFLVSNKKIVMDYDRVEQKYGKFNLDNKYIFPEYIKWRFTSDRVEKLNKQLAMSKALVNSDFKPTLYYQQLKIFWQKMKVWHYSAWWALIFLFSAVVLWLFFQKRQQAADSRQRYLLLAVSSIPEFCLMSFEVLLLLLFQTFIGFLYIQIAITIALILAGITLGSLWFRQLVLKVKSERLVKVSFGIIILSFLIFLIIAVWLKFLFEFRIIYYVLSILAGFAIGTKFPVINKLYLKTSPNMGAVYGIDLIGGALGAFLVGIFMLPVLGVVGSLGMIVGLCMVAFMLIQLKSK